MGKNNYEKEVSIILDNGTNLKGNLDIPKGARAIILFAHGSGSSRFSPRNWYVAEELKKAGLATFLFDLLTAKEEEIDNITAGYRFDIKLLAQRLIGATHWTIKRPETRNLKIGYFGASTGAAAALIAAASLHDIVGAVVSRGGRPDLAESALVDVKVPTLLIVGGKDIPVIELNKKALEKINAKKELKIVPGASHLFEEKGKLKEVAHLATDWFIKYLP